MDIVDEAKELIPWLDDDSLVTRMTKHIEYLRLQNERLRQQNAELVAEPSIKMLLAGKKALFRVVEDPTIDDARFVYEAMIAACKATGGK